MERNKLILLEEATLEESDSSDIPPSDIVSYNELRSCADLYRMYKSNILEISPDFQRNVVWNSAEQTRFVDSLTKQLPIPSMCFAVDYKQQKWMVIDGLQRMSTIIRFLESESWTLSKLEDVDENLSGLQVNNIRSRESSLYYLYLRVENLAVPITMLRCDFSKKSHKEFLFTIFHRLNTGGTKLNNQEIRNCIYIGSFNSLLKELDDFPTWLKLHRLKSNQDIRFKYRELILRFFAYYDTHEQYTGRLSKYLNNYMSDHQSDPPDVLENKSLLFTNTVNFVFIKVFNSKAPPKMSLAVLEALMVGVAKNLTHLQPKTQPQVEALYKKLLLQEEFSEKMLIEGLSGKTRVINRLNKSIQIFSE